MEAAEARDAVLADVLTRFPRELVCEEAAAHANLAVDPPDGQGDPLLVQRLAPGEYMLVNAIDERAVQIEQEAGLDAHRCPLHAAAARDCFEASSTASMTRAGARW